jgi:type II secretory pathway component PulC
VTRFKTFGLAVVNLPGWDYAHQLLRVKPVAENAPRIVAWACAVLIVVQVLEFAHAFRTIDTPSQSSVPLNVPRAHTTDSALIAGAHLFGEPPRPVVVETDETKAVASTGIYSLKGTIAIGSAGGGFAIIAGANGRSDLYEAGHPMANGATLRRVGTDYVLLANNGRLERLTLPHGSLAMQLMAGTTRTQAATAEVTGALTADTRSSLQTFGLSVVADSAGGVTGISGKGSSSWQHSGLEPTDVIVSIDGTPVGDVLNTPGALDNASIAAATTLTVLRAGVQMDITAVPEETAEAPIHSRRRT